jgi:two-component system, chemotaxis family, protein-glutamate methylesterase/glutaminase
MPDKPRTRVLLVDDSAVVRKLLGDALRKHPDIEVIGGAADPYIARDMILQHKPDVITLDIEMPRMDGLSFLRKLMEHYPIPAIVVSSLTQQGSAASVEALRIGAIDVIGKPGGPHAVGEVADRVAERIRALRTGSPIRLGRYVPQPAAATSPSIGASASKLRGIIAIGASTGGTQAIETVLTRLPADMPPIVIAQHMPAGFTRAFAARLDTVCRMHVIEAAGNEPLERGVAYIAPGDHHLTVERQGLRLLTRLDQKAPIHYQRPAVDALFASVAGLRGLPIVGMLLTGMGADGADGMVALRAAGAETIAEAEESCVVFGMPKEAIARGGAVHVASLLAIPDLVFECLGRLDRAARAS